ncbi:MAG: hypothetical protein RQ847_03530 [Wenzhouxiangellaceae bacterium]|nr:hypothetical protein [Wenzhouxiangellaceae bacterium]
MQAVSISGPDAVAFVQSQLTLDIEASDAPAARPAAWCGPDGRAALTLLAGRRDDSVTLIAPASLTGELLRLANRFRIGRRLEIGEPVAAAPAIPAGGIEPQAGRVALAFDPGRALQFGAEVEAQALAAAWLARDIECRMPWLAPETAGRFLPQTLGLAELGGLSYAKGCYPGQEVIARVHYRGRVTRRLTRFRRDRAGEVPGPGTEFAVETADGTVKGVVLYATAPAGTSVTGLAVVGANAPKQAAIRIGAGTGRLI